MLTTTGAEELVQQVSWAIAQYAIYIICNYGGRQANGVLIAFLTEKKTPQSTLSIWGYPCRTFVNSQFMVFWAEKRETSDILKGPSCPCAGVMVELSTSFSTALNGCSKALTVCTVLQREKDCLGHWKHEFKYLKTQLNMSTIINMTLVFIKQL